MNACFSASSEINLCFFLLSFCFFKIEKVHSIIPYYYFPTIKNLEKEGLSIGKNAYQLLFFGQYEESLNLAKLAVKINAKDEKLWLILSEAQVANSLYKNALKSLDKAQHYLDDKSNDMDRAFKAIKRAKNRISVSRKKSN